MDSTVTYGVPPELLDEVNAQLQGLLPIDSNSLTTQEYINTHNVDSIIAQRNTIHIDSYTGDSSSIIGETTNINTFTENLPVDLSNNSYIRDATSMKPIPQYVDPVVLKPSAVIPKTPEITPESKQSDLIIYILFIILIVVLAAVALLQIKRKVLYYSKLIE